MSFGTKNVVVEERKSLGIAYGILKLKWMDFNFRKAMSSDKKQLEIFVEDDNPVGDDGYEYEGFFGKRKALNRTGKVSASIYIDLANDAENIDSLMKSFASLADKTNCREELDKVEADNFEDYVAKAFKVIGGKYAYFSVKAEEYINKNTGKSGLNRSFKSWGRNAPLTIFPVEGSEVVVTGNTQTITTEDGKTYTWDKNNEYDFKPVAVPDEDPVANAPTADGKPTNDLPF